MATYIAYRDGGKTDEVGLSRMTSKLWTGNVLEGLTVEENNPLAMNVIVTPGDVKINHGNGCYYAWSDSNITVTIATADTSNPRVDRIIAYVDTTQAPTTEQANNPGLLKFIAITGTPAANPAAPNDTTVQQAIGAGNPYTDIAYVGVSTSITQVSAAAITDKRKYVAMHQPISFRTSMSNEQAVAPETFTKVNYNSVVYDYGSNYDTENSQFVAPISGLYAFGAAVQRFGGWQNTYRHLLIIFVNGVQELRIYDGERGGTNQTFAFGGYGEILLSAGDTVDIRMWHGITGGGGPFTFGRNDTKDVWFLGHLIGGVNG